MTGKIISWAIIAAYPFTAFLTFGHAYGHYRGIIACAAGSADCLAGSAILGLIAGVLWPLYWVTWLF